MQRRDFRLLFGGQFVSDFGGQLATFALPTIAIFSLHASSLQVGTLTGIEYAVVPMFALFAGVAVDRYRRRRTMVAANIVRTVAIATLVIALALHMLSMPLLMGIAAVAALASLLFDTAYQPFLAGLVGRDDYERANSAMTAGASCARALAIAACGPLVALAGPAVALALNAATYVAGTSALGAIRTREPRKSLSRRSRKRDDFRAGVAIVAKDAVLKRLACTTSLYYFGGAMLDAVLPLYAYRTLHLSPLGFGLLLAATNVGLLAGRFAPSIVRSVGPWKTLVIAIAAIALGDALCFSGVFALLGLVAGRIVIAAAAPAYDVLAQSLATARVADDKLGRMNAALRTLTNSCIPLGCIAGGALVARGGFELALAASTAAFVFAIAACALLARSTGITADRCSHFPIETSAMRSAA